MKVASGILAGLFLLCINGCKLDGGGGGSSSLTSADVSNFDTDTAPVTMFSTSLYLTDDSAFLSSENGAGTGLERTMPVAAAPVPEPATMFLLTMGLGGLAAMKLNRRKKNKL